MRMTRNSCTVPLKSGEWPSMQGVNGEGWFQHSAFFFFLKDPPPPDISPLPLHAAFPFLALPAGAGPLWALELSERAVRLSACPPARLFVNDRLDVALAVGAAGVQLGHGSLAPEDARRLNPAWWIGKSVHDLPEAEAAHAGGADYLLVGPVFPTATHADRAPLGSAPLKQIVR